MDDVGTPTTTGWYKSSRRPAARPKSAPQSTNEREQAEPVERTPSMPSTSRHDPDGVWDWPLCKRQMRYRVLQLFSRGELASDQEISRERQTGQELRIKNAQLQFKAAQAAIEAENAQAETESARQQVQWLSSQASANARKHLECKAKMEALEIENAMLREQLPHVRSELHCCSQSSNFQGHQATIAGRLCQTLVKPRVSQMLQSFRNSTLLWNVARPGLTPEVAYFMPEIEGGALRV